jgi:hypothetical protein
MSDLVTNIFMWGAGIVVLGTAIVLLFAYFVKLRDAFFAGLRGIKLIEPERKTPRWRKALDEWEERHPRLMWIMGCSAIIFLLGGAASGLWSEYHRAIVSFGWAALFFVAGFLDAMDWKFGVLLILFLLTIREIRLLRSLLSAVYDLIHPISQHFERIEAEERERRVAVGFAEYEQESWRKFQAQTEKGRGGSG